MSDQQPVYGPGDWRGDGAEDLGAPGAFPFTRGVHPDMYRGKLWTMRQYAGQRLQRHTYDVVDRLLRGEAAPRRLHVGAQQP